MGYSGSFGKRENDKKKQAKRLEKQKKKDERKSSGGPSSFDDMITYVDANGNIIDTPPEMVAEEVDIETIEISTPKKTDEEPQLFKGRVEHFNTSKGYGFIKDLDSTEKYFFHVTSAPADIAEGQIVTFRTERGTRGMNAVDITRQ